MSYYTLISLFGSQCCNVAVFVCFLYRSVGVVFSMALGILIVFLQYFGKKEQAHIPRETLRANVRPRLSLCSIIHKQVCSCRFVETREYIYFFNVTWNLSDFLALFWWERAGPHTRRNSECERETPLEFMSQYTLTSLICSQCCNAGCFFLWYSCRNAGVFLFCVFQWYLKYKRLSCTILVKESRLTSPEKLQELT